MVAKVRVGIMGATVTPGGSGWGAGEPFEPDFGHAVQRHTLLAAIERSSTEGRAIRASSGRDGGWQT